MREGDEKEVERIFDALGNARRRKILALLGSDGAMSSGELAEAFDCSWAAISKHLQVLIRADLIGRYDSEIGKRQVFITSARGLKIAEEWLKGLR
jgi:predicted transcriptional regulator